jgi:methionyl-tRNA formyltransferase
LSQSFRILFMGTSDFAVPALKALHQNKYEIVLVVTQPDRPAGRGLELKASPVKKAALELGLPVYQPEKIKNPEAVEKLQALKPDVTVVAAYGQILPLSVLQAAKTACLNIHGSILPKYRGAAPIHYAVMAGEKETGVTLMYMNEKMDEGDILLIKKTPIGPEETTGEVHDRLAVLGAQGLLETLELLKEGKAPRLPQNHLGATYSPSLKREQCRVRWDATASQVVNKIRGLNPWPVAETKWKEMDLKVLSAVVQNPSPNEKNPGEILMISKDGILVNTGLGSVLIQEIQPPGKKRMKAYDFTLGQPLFKPGEILS